MRFWPFSLSKRNRALADQYLAQVGQPLWSDLSIEKAVKEGYKKNGWVYKSVRMISGAASSVPWMVYNSEKEPMPEHPISMLMVKPNPRISRQKLIELLVAWQQLTGNAYLLPTVKLSTGVPEELWPVSPDRLKPIPTTDPTEWVKGYALDQSTKVDYEQEEVIHFLYPDPAQPIIGIGPLQAAAKAVDVDNEQQDWNKASLEKRGVLDGVFSFKREFKKLEDLEDVTEKLNEKFTGKTGRRIGAVGSEATYTRIAATPQEMDSIENRKFTREEIFIIFGIPPQLAGAQESSTYNNYATAELVFWLNTVVGVLDDLKDTFNFSFSEHLRDGETLGYDLSNVPAIRRAKMEQIKSGKMLAEMGVPVERINTILELSIEEYEGWDKSNPKGATQATDRESSDDSEEERVDRIRLTTMETRRSPEAEAEARELEALQRAEVYTKLFQEQKTRVFTAMNTATDIRAAVEASNAEWLVTIDEHYKLTASKWAEEIIIPTRSFEDEVNAEVARFLELEAVSMQELMHINEATMDAIILQIDDALLQGLPIAASQQALIDMGIFEAERALRVARTITGAAASVGQLSAGKLSGATLKVWETSSFDVRKIHKNRSKEQVGIDGRFSIQGKSTVGPRFPGDPDISAGDRINCRCSLTFI